MIEMLHAAEVIRSLLDDPDILGGETHVPRPTGAKASASSRPRGTLIHHYRGG